MDNKLPSNASGFPKEESSIKPPYMTDAPPTAVTPADSGSDFYNTPFTAATPVNNDDGKANADPSHTGATSSLKPAAHIPGLSLVNNGLSSSQSPSLESISHKNTEGQNIKEVVDTEMQNGSADHGTQATEHGKQESGPFAGEAMEVEQGSEEHAQGEDTDWRVNDNTDNATVPVAESTQEAGQADEPREWETDSSPYESSSDNSTTDSDDDSDEEDEDYPILSPEEQARILMQVENDSDDEGAKGKSGSHIKSANEVAEEAPPIPDITITPDMKIVHLGHVQSIVENALLIEASVSGEYQVLESGSLLCTENREVVGVVSETLGRVESPLYAVLYPTAAAIEERGLFKEKQIYYVESHSTFVFTQPLKGIKGSDASNFHDEEIGEDEVEFSDDEAEAEHKRKLKQKRQDRKNARNESGPARARREPPGPSKLSKTELNYDDAADDGYTPLARPKNLHEMMGNQEAPVEADGPRRGGFRGRGRGGGFDRGGGRGRGGRSGDHRSHYDIRQNQQETPAAQPPTQFPNYSQPAYQGQPNAYAMPQQFAQYAQFLQQQPPQQPYAQGSPLPQFPFQMPNQQAYQQQNPYQQMFPNPHVNPLFLAAMQQQQQPQGTAPPQTQNQAMNFDQVKAQLDILRRLSNGNQGPPPA